jgi:hypothetical protein
MKIPPTNTKLTVPSGGRADFKWEDVKQDAQRENYLGHSLMARACPLPSHVLLSH